MRYIVLLRGVNVGKGNRVPMAEFRALLEELGHTEVKTLLNSGNAVFTSAGGSGAAHAAAIARALHARLGVKTPVIVKSADELAAIVGANPMVPPEAEHARFLVTFAPDAAALQALAPIQALALGADRFVITPHAAYLHCPGGLLDSPAGAALLGKAGRGVTTRNWATVLKLAALAGVGAG
jgi:uncharacterized protein (DUF1697 family)